MKFGFATPFASASGQIEYSLLREIKGAGYDYVELPGVAIAKLESHEVTGLCKELKSLGLNASSICTLLPASMNVFSADRYALKEYLKRLFGRFAQIGVQGIGFGSGAARTVPEGKSICDGMDEYAEILCSTFLPLLYEYNFKLFIEPLRKQETNLINSLAEGLQIVRMADSDRIGLLSDTMHMMYASEDAESVAACREAIGHIHISEYGRLLPEETYSPGCLQMLSLLLENGYSKAISFETKHGTENGPERALALLKETVASATE